MLTLSRLAEQYWRVYSMDTRIPASEEEKLQISSANSIERIGRSCRVGGEHLVVKAKIRSATNKLKSSGERGSPCRRPTLEEKGVPNMAPSLMQEEAFSYMFSINWQNLGPRPEVIIFLNRRGRHTLSYAF